MPTILVVCKPNNLVGKLSSRVSKSEERKVQKPTCGVARKKGGDPGSKRHGH